MRITIRLKSSESTGTLQFDSLIKSESNCNVPIDDKAQSMTNAAARAGGTYTSTGNYSDVLSSILPSNIDKKE
ncbi:MAG: hypothetical protein IJ260_00105 [Butyrivibrio sp.]|nr:hypothetical protein [Butyrivibrio sp.]MBQ8029935.1 hypothetical protein [Butyrivibrio sp.]MBR1642763.1 hypothetical protein [Butyrivibrio sp.]